MTQTKREIRSLLAAAGIRPLKRFGQHFLIDGNLMRKLASAAQIRDDDVVLEVGPGTGALTEHLLEQAGHVVAVEVDRGLHAICQSRFAGSARLTLIRGDVLERKSAVAGAVLEALSARQQALEGRILLVANLPYQIATPLLIDLLLGELKVSPLCFTVQAEVADRLTAPPGGKNYGPISIIAQAWACAELIASVPPKAFWPVPKVSSTMLRLDEREEDRLPRTVQAKFSALVHGCFSHRRKTMHSNLRALLDAETFARVEADGRWDLSDRPERITVRQWVDLATLLSHV